MNIAIFNSEQETSNYLSETLVCVGYQCHLFTERETMFAHMKSLPYDLLILDTDSDYAEQNGVLQQARQFLSPQLPILCVTSRSEEDDIVNVLSNGADACMIKPVHSCELICRVKAILRRVHALQLKTECPSFGFYLFDTALRKIYLHNKRVDTTPKEFELALMMFRNLNKPLSQKYLYSHIWDQSFYGGSHTLVCHISRIRNKLELQYDKDYWLKSSSSGGYVLEQRTRGIPNQRHHESSTVWYRSAITA